MQVCTRPSASTPPALVADRPNRLHDLTSRPIYNLNPRSTDFTGYRFVPVGVIVATCTTPRTLPYTFGTSPRVLVGSGKLLTYRIRFRSTDPVSALTGVKVDISLPPYVTVASTATLPLPERRNKASGAGIMSGGVVTWQNMTIAPKKSRIFRVRMHVAQNTPRATVLSFGCTLFQTNASPGGDPYCPMRMQDWTVSGCGERTRGMVSSASS